jgi:hypothetical protein
MSGNNQFNVSDGANAGFAQHGGSNSEVNALYLSAYGDGRGNFNNGGSQSNENMIYMRPQPNEDPSIQIGGHKFPIGIGPIDIPNIPNFPNPDFTKPTDQQETTAEKKLDKEIPSGQLISATDKQNLQDIDHAILTGDDKALAATLAKYADDPEKLKAVVGEVNKELKDSKSGVGLQMSDDGKVYAYRDDGHKAVEMDPQTGEVTGVRKIMVGPDGKAYIGDYDKNADPDKVMEHVADRAVNNINDPFQGFDQEWGTKLKHHWGKHHHGGLNPIDPMDPIYLMDNATTNNNNATPRPDLTV